MTTILSTGIRPIDMTDMRDALEAGGTTSAALVERAIERAEAVNPQLNFIAWPTFERARGQAVDPRAGPLAGIPTMIKDMLPEKECRPVGAPPRCAIMSRQTTRPMSVRSPVRA
jgi:amidase